MVELITIFLLIQVVLFGYHLIFLSINGYLDIPFLHIHRANDFWMDFINTNFWYLNEGMYSFWKSIYTPFQFVIISFFDYENTVYIDPYALRDEISYPLIMIFIYLSANLLLFIKAKKKIARILLFYLFISYPSLMVVERLNYIILAYFIYVLYLIMTESENYRFLAYWLISSLKIYFIFFLFLEFFRNKKIYATIIFCTIIITNWFMGVNLDDSPIQVLNNIFDFGVSPPFSLSQRIWMGNSIVTLLTTYLVYIKSDFLILTQIISALLVIFVSIKSSKYVKSTLELELLGILTIMVLTNSAGVYLPIFLMPLIVLNIEYFYTIKYFLFFLLIPFLLVPFGIEYNGVLLIEGLDGLGLYKNSEIPLMSLVNPVATLISYLIFISKLKNEKRAL